MAKRWIQTAFRCHSMLLGQDIGEPMPSNTALPTDKGKLALSLVVRPQS